MSVALCGAGIWPDACVAKSRRARQWRRLVREVVFARDDGVRQLAKAFTSYGRTQGLGFAGMGDVVAKRVTQVSPESMAGLMNLDAFWSRVESVAATGADPEIQEFMEAWRRADQGRGG
ncbi:hypothetical protein OHZ10_36000 [Burkholderia arboris]|uniref:Uncharacterized protein n=1 Tax=Burkholderia arboris TaxID=488730 RepID=A0ABZ3DUV4_9BURK